MSDKDFRRFDPIVPERDGPPPKPAAPKGPALSDDPRDAVRSRPAASPSRARTPRDPAAGAPAWLLYGALLAVLIVAGFAWYQSRVLADLNARFSQLSARIESTDESLNQSGATLGLKIREQEEKLAEHWAEIRKLWGVSYDTNRKAIAENTKAIEGHKASLATLQANLKKAESTLASLQQSVETAKKQAAEANQGVAGIRASTLGAAAQVDELREKVATLTSTLATTNSGVNQLKNDLGRRVAENEQALRAMDTYRAQVNQQLNQLRQQVSGAP